MERKWTPQQLDAIESTGGSVLVSAAAGSGKTAVLVERVIRLITAEKNPVDADRLLIVTFTRDAASEMKQRISLALNRLLEDDPYNPQLIRQKQLLYNASICTIDSFCANIIREYFHVLEISPDYRTADDGELHLMQSEAMDKAIEAFYSSDSKEFTLLLDAFSGKDGDTNLRKTVLRVHDFLNTQPFPEQWLEELLSNYKSQNVSKSIWGQIISDYAQSAVAHGINLTENSIKLLDDEVLTEKLRPVLEDDLSYLNSLQEKLLGNSWDEAVIHINSKKLKTLATPKGYKEHPTKIAIAANRDEFKKTNDKLKRYFCRSEQEAKAEFEELYQIVKVLFALVKKYIAELDALKSKRNILTFSDTELLTVRLLAKPDKSGGYLKTEQAYEISKRYDAVIVDEYQDVNDVQNLIFNCVSSEESNLFVVGDVKQSIYGFRQAKPQIFLGRRDSYNRFDRDLQNYPATIVLDKNFRSRSEVCDSVNFIFSRLMSRQSAQMDYTADERLNVGAVYPETDDCNLEISIIEKRNFDDASTPQLEATYIANKIKQMMSSGFTVTDSGTRRKPTYGDFAIIMRSPKSSAQDYVNTLIANGIPAYSEENESAFDAQEVKILLNFMRVIDNPALDIPMLSVLCSPIYGFTPDELAQLRANNRRLSLYHSLRDYAEKNEKAKQFLSQLTTLRSFSYTCTVDELIGKIYEVSSIGAITSAIRGGDNPLSNLNLIRHYARSYEANGYKTLSDFIHYIDKLIDNGTSLPSDASQSLDSLNGVRILSIHKSKGLEYPVCFLAGTAKKFNKTDLTADVLIDSFAGLGIKRKKGVCRYNTLPRLAVEIEIEKNEIAEELRVLYVALTRAREKLIIVGSVTDTDKYIEKLTSKLVFNSIIEPYTVSNSASILDWICLTALANPSVRTQMNTIAEHIILKENYPDWIFHSVKSFEELTLGIEQAEEIPDYSEFLLPNETDVDYKELLQKNLSFQYPNADILSLPQKVSASQVAHNQSNDYFDRIIAKPSFLSKESVAAVERGTAHHLFLQFCDFERARDDIRSEIIRLKHLGRLSESQAQSIDENNLSKLLHSALFDRVIQSVAVYREERFTAKIAPSFIYDEYKGIETDAKIILQGAVDLAFEQDGKLVIVDYKTDRVKDMEKLCQLYQKQLELYKEALSQTFEKEVSECIICSIHLNTWAPI